MTAKNRTLTILILISVYIFASCEAKKNKPGDVNEIILKTGTIEITRYEFEKNKKKELSQQKETDSLSWIKKYIADSYFLADAYSRKYDSATVISKRVNYAAITMMGKYKGYLWNKIEEPKLTFSDDELKAVYQKKDKLFHLEFLLFDSKDSFDVVLRNRAQIKTEAEFRKIVDIGTKSRIQYRKTQLFFPFGELSPVKDEIYRSTQGNIIQAPFENGKMLVAYISKVEKKNQQPFVAEKQNIYSNLRRLKERQIIDRKHDSIFHIAGIVMNESVVQALSKKIKGPFIQDIPKTIKNDTLLTYFFNKKNQALLMRDFADYYQNNPFNKIITNKEALKETLKGIVIEKYLYADCLKFGLTNDKQYILDRKNFKNRLVLDAYSRDNFYNTKPSEQAVSDYYKVNQQHFLAPKACHVSVFTFKDIIAAGTNLFHLDKMLLAGTGNFSDTSALKGLLSYRPDVLLSNKNYPYQANMVANVFTAKPNTAIGPFEWNNRGYVFVKTKEEGQEPLPLDVAREAIERELIAENAEILKEKKLKELKSKYALTINKLTTE
ncbi:peptidylprolyl isomerase [uncultured Mucilaginibacter sp.]|uniref:peptidylprolyl isomerase n=1 Tax=uncultured Mucilaginibacter sp. TaxID=797541 RepID=UPI002607820F|nr:peptidylprolyl isomerase [uncultured Mucilaginibacter sp.]